ncbi:MAG: CHASE4 domain-containing protein, partial [Thermodesulfobacteriota bacterium]|nr:CHASE4 domain-containing protein [Thermodesulfobacteriota bacterium]
MSLRKSAILIIIITFVGLLAILYGTSRYIILSSFIDLEKQIVGQNLERGRNALDNEIAKIDSFANDWGAWDDTYEFVVDKNDEYIRSNLADETFMGIPLSVMLFCDASGALVWGGAFDLEEEKASEISGELMKHLSPDSPLLRHSDTESRVN